MIIEIEGKKFADGEKGLINSLFEKGGTCYGYYKRYKRHVIFYYADGRKFMLIGKFGVPVLYAKYKDGFIGAAYLLGDYQKHNAEKTDIFMNIKDLDFSYSVIDIAEKICIKEERSKKYSGETEYWYK